MKDTNLYDASFVNLKEGDIITGRVVKRIGNSILIDLGLKSEGFLLVEEFKNPADFETGKEVSVFLEALENKEGIPVISKKKADFLLAWEKIKRMYETGEPAQAQVRKRIKGGFLVEILGVDAFLPGSQIDLKSQIDEGDVISQTISVKIVKLNWLRKNIVVSRRILIEEEQEKAKRKVFDQVKLGDVIEGVVRNITEFGAFIDVGGVDALLHVADLSWGKVTHPSEVLKIGEKVNVKILSLDFDSGRISVGLKQLTPHPWDGIEERYPVGNKIKGRVTSVIDYGAFVELEKGVEGLVHISEMSWTKSIKHPSQLLEEGDNVEADVLSIDRDNKRISLGIKQTKPDPWSVLDQSYKIGEKVTVRVKKLKEYGAFVELEEGIEGLIHLSDFSWTKKIKHPKEILKRGQKIEAVVIKIDRENRRIALSLKHTKEDPFEKFIAQYPEGAIVKGKIVDLLSQGIGVQLDFGIEEFVPVSKVSIPKGKKTKDVYSLGSELELQVDKINHKTRRINLSEKGVKESVETAEVQEIPKEEKARFGDFIPRDEKKK